jgi:ferritin-like metal-binding protein YciE
MSTEQIDNDINDWLRDAHAMEEQAESMLETHAERLENYPELRQRIDQHLRETRSQRERLEACMDRRGVSASGMKDLGAKFSAFMGAVGGSMAGDEVLKGTIGSYAFEHFEAANYRVLASAAKQAGDAETARVCEEICKEEEAMADWLASNMPQVTATYLQRRGADLAEAKR